MKQNIQFTTARRCLMSFLLLVQSSLFAGHNTSRYFHFLEKPEPATTRSPWYISSSAFFTTAATAFGREGGNAGIPELWGDYDLDQVIQSLTAVRAGQGIVFENPFLSTAGVEGLAGKPVLYRVDGKIRTGGFFLDIARAIFKPNLYIGANIGVARLQTSSRFHLMTTSRDPLVTIDPHVAALSLAEIAQVERVRLGVHREIGICPGDWDEVSFTDLDLYLRWHTLWDHFLLMRMINFNVLGGVVMPTSNKMPLNFISAAPLMGDRHWGFYLDIHSEFELKPDWHVGCQLSFMYQLNATRCRRIPIAQEPAIFSALTGRLHVSPGSTFKVAPYLMIKNLVDGLHFDVRYTYIRHGEDRWSDERIDQSITSVLTRAHIESLQDEAACAQLREHLRRTSWRSQYFTLRLQYEPREACRKLPLDPLFTIAYDIPYYGLGIAKTHHIWLSLNLRF